MQFGSPDHKLKGRHQLVPLMKARVKCAKAVKSVRIIVSCTKEAPISQMQTAESGISFPTFHVTHACVCKCIFLKHHLIFFDRIYNLNSIMFRTEPPLHLNKLKYQIAPPPRLDSSNLLSDTSLPVKDLKNRTARVVFFRVLYFSVYFYALSIWRKWMRLMKCGALRRGRAKFSEGRLQLASHPTPTQSLFHKYSAGNFSFFFFYNK